MNAGIDFAGIRAAHPLAQFCESRGIVLGRNGASGRLVGLCPIHEEKTPSFTLYPDGYFYCYGCGAHGDVVDLCAAIDGIAIGEAAAKLSVGAAFHVIHTQEVQSAKTAPHQLSKEGIDRMASAAHRLATDTGLIEKLVAKRPEWNAVTIRNAAFNGDLGFEAGRILFGYRHGIKARWKDISGERVIRWICGSAQGECWRQSALLRQRCRVYVTEGETDCLTLLSLGLENSSDSVVIGLPSANSLPHPAPFSGKDVVLVLDPDEPGEATAKKLRALLETVARSVATVELKEVKNG
jgi:DNA primase